MLLAGDIGGTKTNLALYPSQGTARQLPFIEATFPSGHYPSLEAIINQFLSNLNLPEAIDHACFGVAGPVVNRTATVTNLPWVMDESQLAHTLQVPYVHILNDLEAIAHAVPLLGPADVSTLNEGHVVSQGAIAVIAPGTGLGEGFLTWNGNKYQAHTSEGGHADFAPSNELEIDLLRYLFARYRHVSFERVCSGKGIPNIYHFLKESGYARESPELAERLANAEDPTPLIFNAALRVDEPDEICVATLNTFVSILGAETGNLALKVLATGGVYLGGGIPPRILPLLAEGQFMQAFQRKGRFTELLGHIPVHVILNPKVALLGAASAGLAYYEQH
ncbi:MAG TPA: glucokinase [Ktedonobacteraceae bacterium]|nr:glucokinase [Ktedonobacteraceae bacterium]